MPNTALYTSVYNDVMTLTKRLDLSAETTLAIKQATLTTHLSDFYPRDIVSSTINSAVSNYSQQFDTTIAPFSAFRDVAGCQLLDVNGAPIDSPKVEVVNVRDIWEYGYDGIKKQNICWLAGTMLNVYTTMGSYGANIDWYQSPILDPTLYNSWIAQNYSDPIVQYAAAFVWNRSGNEQKAKAAMDLYTQLLIPSLKANFLHSQGR